MFTRIASAVLLALAAFPLALRLADVRAAPLAQLPLCGRPLSASGPHGFPPVLHLGARLSGTAVSEHTGHTFVGLSGQGGSSDGRIALRCHSSVTTIDTASGRLLGRTAVGVEPAGMAVDDRDGRVFVAGFAEAGYPARITPALTILDTRGQMVKPAMPFPACPCAGGAMGMLEAMTDGAIRRVFVVTLESVVTFDAVTGVPLATVPADVAGAGGIPNFGLDTRYHRVFIATSTGVTIIDGRTGALAQTINLGESERVLAVDSRTSRVFVAEWAGCRGGQGGSAAAGVVVLDAASGAHIGHVLGSCVGGMLMDEPAGRVLVGLSGDSTGQNGYAVLDAGSGKVLRTLRTSWPLVYSRTAVEPGSGPIYSLADGSVRVLDPRGWRDAGRIPLPVGADGFLTIASRVHRLLVSDPYRGVLRILPVWPPATG
jgi:DNA-binding beta-propeller fold protein YncE